MSLTPKDPATSYALFRDLKAPTGARVRGTLEEVAATAYVDVWCMDDGGNITVETYNGMLDYHRGDESTTQKDADGYVLVMDEYGQCWPVWACHRNSILGLTHFMQEEEGPMVHCFAIDRCETCNEFVEGPNAINIDRPSAEVYLIPWRGARFPEQYHDEDSGQCVCQRCAR